MNCQRICELSMKQKLYILQFALYVHPAILPRFKAILYWKPCIPVGGNSKQCEVLAFIINSSPNDLKPKEGEETTLFTSILTQ